MARDLVTRGRAFAPALKTVALLALPAPLSLAALASLIDGDLPRLALTGGALACLWGAAVLVWNGLVAEARYRIGERPNPPVFPLKLSSAGLTGVGVALAATAAAHSAGAVLVFAALALVGHVAFYGPDLRPPRVRVALVDGVDVADVTRQLEAAHGRLRAIDAAAHAIAAPEFRERLRRITAIGRSIVGAIEQDPRDAPRARRFLHLYLDSAERVTTDYARTHARIANPPLDDNFRGLLVEMEQTFAAQQRTLAERDVMSLDVDIDVLNARLRNEGRG